MKQFIIQLHDICSTTNFLQLCHASFAIKIVLQEGDDIYFECNIESNPPPYKVTWLLNVSSFYIYN